MNALPWSKRFRRAGHLCCGLLACGLAVYASAGGEQPTQELATDEVIPRAVPTASPAPGASAPQTAITLPSVPQAAIADAQPAEPVAAKKRVRDISYDKLKFQIKLGQKFQKSLLTPEIEALRGERVKVRGWMHPSAYKEQLTQFIFVRDNKECCFGPDAMIYDCISVTMAAGSTAKFSSFAIVVEGTLDIEPIEDEEGVAYILYHLRDAHVP